MAGTLWVDSLSGRKRVKVSWAVISGSELLDPHPSTKDLLEASTFVVSFS
jgi:hypothetical protein